METIIGKEFPNKVIPLIKEAQHSIKIIVFDWRWYPQDVGSPVMLFNDALLNASRRGVNVSVITNADDIIATLNRLGIHAKKLFTKNLVHVKQMIIDSRILILGSHNYTQNAFTMNYEVSLIIKDDPAIADLERFFDSLFF